MKVPRVLVLALIFVWSVQLFAAQELPIPTAEKIPGYRGFNLLEKFVKGHGDNGPFKEADFQLISEWGFNFVRLPMDYRIWIADGDWTKFDEKQFKEIDQAVEYGKKYNIHVCINFHRAPGYTVASPPESTNLWTDAETQRICAMHWAYFAKRYKDVPNKYLSFNLVNEPGEIASADYAKVAKMLIAAIRAEDPDRLIFSDGMQWGRNACMELLPCKVAQFTRGYSPFELTHYKASWVNGSENWPIPQWPVPLSVSGYLFGPSKKELRSPILIQADMDCPMQMALHIGMVSAEAELTIWDDDQKIFSQAFHPGPGDGPWKQSIYKERWNVYQNIYDRDYPVELSAGTHTLRIENTAGDWLTLTQITFQTRGGLACVYPVLLSVGYSCGCCWWQCSTKSALSFFTNTALQ